uniref:J domain-containing protein n=1 Tax=Myotis lucifugus TaxID=59463 RepID=G1QBK2_MYOLU
CQWEPVGRWSEAFVKRNRNASAPFQKLEDKKELSAESEDEELQLEEFPTLKTLDPTPQHQDHQAALGLGHVRYKAPGTQIAAHKAKFKHHPDKGNAAGAPTREGDNDHFTCIAKAHEMLSDPVKRPAFNSVDPTSDNLVPSNSEAKDNFFQVFPVFERNSRWSNKKICFPKLGDMNSSFEDIDVFYSLWYNFYSWREFSYLDEEEEKQSVLMRGGLKQNGATRAQREKRKWTGYTVVDNEYSYNPRIKNDRRKGQERSRKESKSRSKIEQEAKENHRQAECLAEEKEEEEIRQHALLAKKEKHTQKRHYNGKAKTLKLMQDLNHFSDNEAKWVNCDCLELASLQCLNETHHQQRSRGGKREEINEQIRKEKEEAEAHLKNAEKSTVGGGNGSENWSEDLKLRSKAVNLFPAGTNSRWEVYSYNTHSSGVKRTTKDVIKAKSFQKLDPHQKDDITKKLLVNFREHGLVPQADNDTPAEQFEGPCTDFTPWTIEQKLL